MSWLRWPHKLGKIELEEFWIHLDFSRLLFYLQFETKIPGTRQKA